MFEPLNFWESFEHGVGDFMNKGNVNQGFIYNNFEKGISETEALSGWTLTWSMSFINIYNFVVFIENDGSVCMK